MVYGMGNIIWFMLGHIWCQFSSVCDSAECELNPECSSFLYFGLITSRTCLPGFSLILKIDPNIAKQHLVYISKIDKQYILQAKLYLTSRPIFDV